MEPSENVIHRCKPCRKIDSKTRSADKAGGNFLGNGAKMTLDIRIMDRASAADIDEEDWVSLEKNACVPNPFYERWNLLSALKYLDRKDTVYVIAAYDQDRLVCLFPVCLMKKAGLFKFLAIWRFRDCLRTDVLRVSDISLSTIFLEVMQHFSAKALVSATHEKWHIDAQLTPNFCDVLKS